MSETTQDSAQQSPDNRPEWKCRCPCHKAPLAVVHTVPCCEPCPHCGEAVARGMLNFHLKDCKKYRTQKRG